MRNIYNPIEVDEDLLLRDDERHELLYSKINSLPENIQEILFDQSTDDTLKKIADQFQLNQKQVIETARLVRKILIAEIYLGDIVSETASRLQIGENTAREVANQLITELFAPALEDIKKLHMEKFPGRPINQSTPKPLPPSAQPKQPEQNVNPNNVLDLRKTS